jgi:hypothetical protein
MLSFDWGILIVEDNKIDVRLVKDTLEARGYDTLQTGDGLEAIDLVVQIIRLVPGSEDASRPVAPFGCGLLRPRSPSCLPKLRRDTD